jgi:tRNA (mo5U34)-methyltransferase
MRSTSLFRRRRESHRTGGAAAPSQPEGFDPGSFFAGIVWHQRWEMYRDVHTPGLNPVATILDRAAVPEDLTGRTVLDIGTWNGGCAFECARRGAARVVGLGPEDPEQTGFCRIQRQLGLTNVDYVKGSVYDIDRSRLGTFDVVLLFGVIYHLRYPLLALDKVYEVAAQDLFVESHVIDRYFLAGGETTPRRLARLSRRLPRTPLWRFYQFDELLGDGTNWFGPNLCALKAAVESAGFAIRHGSAWNDRAALWARKAERQFRPFGRFGDADCLSISVKPQPGASR